MMTTDMRKPLPKTFSELVARNYVIKGTERYFDLIEQFHHINLFPNAIDITDSKEGFSVVKGNFLRNRDEELMEDICSTILNPSSRTAFLGDLNFIEDVKGRCHFDPPILEEVLYEGMTGLAMPLHHFLYNHIVKVTQRLVEAGILQNWYEHFQLMTFRSWVEPEASEPQVLTLDGLAFGFNIWLGTCGVAVVVFIAEIIHFRCFGEKKAKEECAGEVPPAAEESSAQTDVDVEQFEVEIEIESREDNVKSVKRFENTIDEDSSANALNGELVVEDV
jgi:hypothetical protein